MKIVIPGAPVTKKNSQQIITNRKTGRPIVIPSRQYKAYETHAIKTMDVEADEREIVNGNPIDYPVNIKCVFYMPTHRRVDLCNLLEAACDVLTAARVIEDDNSNIVCSHDGSRVVHDKENPRTEIEIERIADDE